MIECTRLPVVRCVAAGAVGDTVDDKLVAMDVVMACRTFRCQAGEDDLTGADVLLIRDVALCAGDLIMPPCKWPASETVIEIDKLPCIGDMAACTILARVVLISNTAGVDVLVTVHTRRANVPEHPLVLMQMAGKAGRRKVCPGECKCSFIVLLNRKCRSGKAVHRMA